MNKTLPGLSAALLVLLAPAAFAQQTAPAPAAPTAAASSDPVLSAMLAELDRSKSQLKMDNLPSPYYVEYRVSDVEEFDAEAAFGALRVSQRTHVRSLRVVVRVGDYKQDSYGPGQGSSNLAPIDDDPLSLRRALWEATDQAYKSATQALAAKKAGQTQFSGDQGFDDFAHTDPLQSIGPLAKLDFLPQTWTDAIVKATALYKTDPKLDSLSANVRFSVANEYFVNTEGTITRSSSQSDVLSLSAYTQAPDGMGLVRSPDFVASRISDLPTPDQFLDTAARTLQTLKQLRDAPVVEEDYSGPVLFSPDAAADLFSSMVAANVEGVRPRAGDTARTTGAFASSYKGRVLPAFLSVTDDPTLAQLHGKSLVGSYAVDDEGVRAQKTPLIENGMLTNYLLTRQPIRDFPQSNGHGRAAPGQAPRPSVSNLLVDASESVPPADLKEKLIDMCRDANKPYGYYADTLLVASSQTTARGTAYQISPLLLYRIYVQDGRQELVRGATFNELDTRALRNDIVAAGNDLTVNSYGGGIPSTVVAPSLLFDELEIRRSNQKNPKLPAYDPPSLSSSASR
jgi:TldD protein